MAEKFLNTEPAQETQVQNVLVQNSHRERVHWMAPCSEHLPAEGAMHIHCRASAALRGQGALLSKLNWDLESLHPFMFYYIC